MKKITTKLFALTLAICLLSMAFVACENTRGEYSVTYAAGEGTGTVPEQQYYDEGDTFEVADGDVFTRQDYVFSGWYDGEKTVQPGSEYTMPAHDVTFTAQWTAQSRARLEGKWSGGTINGDSLGIGDIAFDVSATLAKDGETDLYLVLAFSGTLSDSTDDAGDETGDSGMDDSGMSGSGIGGDADVSAPRPDTEMGEGSPADGSNMNNGISMNNGMNDSARNGRSGDMGISGDMGMENGLGLDGGTGMNNGMNDSARNGSNGDMGISGDMGMENGLGLDGGTGMNNGMNDSSRNGRSGDMGISGDMGMENGLGLDGGMDGRQNEDMQDESATEITMCAAMVLAKNSDGSYGADKCTVSFENDKLTIKVDLGSSETQTLEFTHWTELGSVDMPEGTYTATEENGDLHTLTFGEEISYTVTSSSASEDGDGASEDRDSQMSDGMDGDSMRDGINDRMEDNRQADMRSQADYDLDDDRQYNYDADDVEGLYLDDMGNRYSMPNGTDEDVRDGSMNDDGIMPYSGDDALSGEGSVKTYDVDRIESVGEYLVLFVNDASNDGDTVPQLVLSEGANGELIANTGEGERLVFTAVTAE